MTGKNIWKQNESSYLIFKQYFDSLIPILLVTKLFTQHGCLVCGSTMFVLKKVFKFLLGITKTGEFLKVIFAILCVKLMHEFINSY